jgi:hypothetical protein
MQAHLVTNLSAPHPTPIPILNAKTPLAHPFPRLCLSPAHRDRSRTYIIANLSPSHLAYKDTLNTFRHIVRTKEVKKVARNEAILSQVCLTECPSSFCLSVLAFSYSAVVLALCAHVRV